MTDREIVEAVQRLIRMVQARARLEPAYLDCPGYDDLVREGRLRG